RTPLNAIIGFSQLISLSDIDDDIKTDVKEIHKAGKHLLNLINDILDLSKIEAGKISVSIENININDITHECLLLIDEAARSSNIHIINSLKIDEVIYIVGDHTRTKQVILNLLSNAVKYNNIDGSIRIKHEHLDDRLRISISNTGPTLDIDQQKKLFTPFERLGQENSTVEGTGIGLLVTKKLIERMNGDIGYDIDSDNNSTFWIELPLGSIQASDLLHNNTTEPERTTSNKRAGKILYIEDNQANIRLIESILKHTPHEIKSAYDGDSGLSILEQYQPDLVLLDINLPGADGYEILASIKANPNINTTPVIAVTANATKSDISKGMQAGFTHYITKPIDASEFLNTVEQYI
ncbi:MAG: response regulator, partial [Gammaproteobacteria bacterium]|nr:response regulator [Gammaproteobacteria bacterium]